MPLPVSEEEYYTGLPLEVVAWMLRDAKLLVTLTTGWRTLEVPSCYLYHNRRSIEWGNLL